MCKDQILNLRKNNQFLQKLLLDKLEKNENMVGKVEDTGKPEDRVVKFKSLKAA